MEQHSLDESLPGPPDQERGLEAMSALELAETLEDGFLAVDATGHIQAVKNKDGAR